MTIFYMCLTVFCAICLLAQLIVLYESRHILELRDIDAPDPAEWPSLSVIVTACNEGDTIESALSSLLRVDYPNLEIVAVNDRSIDDTGQILDELATTHPKLKVIHIDTLPDRWLGKLHAMHVGTEASTGDFVLYCDADVHFGTESLRRAMAWVERDQLDHLSLIPRMNENSVLSTALMMSIGCMWLVGTRPSRVNRDKKGGYGGTGAFNLVRRSTYNKTEGWTWLKMDIADDVGLAYLLYRHGAKSRLGVALEDLELNWYASTAAVITGLEKNMFPVAARFSILRALALSFGSVAFVLSPWMLLFTPWYWVGVGTLLGLIAIVTFGPSMGPSWIHKVLSTQMGLVFAVIIMRSTYKTVRRGAVDWRGTQYAISDLRAEQRVKW